MCYRILCFGPSVHDLALLVWGEVGLKPLVGGLVGARFFIAFAWDLDLGACALVRVTLALEPIWGQVGFEPSRWRLQGNLLNHWGTLPP